MKMLKSALAAALIACASPALAYDFTQALQGVDGKPIGDPGTKAEATLGSVVAVALLSVYQDEQEAAAKTGPTAIDEYGREKARRYALWLKVHDQKDAPLSADEVTLIKRLVGRTYPPLIVGQVWMILDPAGVPK